MKQNTLKALLLGLVILTLLSSCKQISSGKTEKEKTENETHMEKVMTLAATDTISVAKFNSWVGAWISNGREYTDSVLLRYFTMPLVDLTQVLGETPSSSRFYFGLDTTGSSPVPHLLLVGVDSLGKDMIDPNKNQFIYDVTRPCPAFCGN